MTLARRAFDPIDRDRFKPMPTRVSVSKPSRESGRGDSRKLLLARRSNTWKRRLFWISDKISTKKKNIRVTEIPYASTRNTRKKYRTTPAVPKGHRLLRSPTVCRVFSQSVTRRSASAPLKKTLFLLKRPNRLFRVGHVERTPVSTRPLLGARTRSQAKMSTTDEDPDKVVKNSWTPEVRSIHAPSRSPRARCFRRAWTVKSQGGYFAFAAASGGGSPARRFALDRDRDPEIRISRASRSLSPSPNAGGRVASRANQ